MNFKISPISPRQCTYLLFMNKRVDYIAIVIIANFGSKFFCVEMVAIVIIYGGLINGPCCLSTASLDSLHSNLKEAITEKATWHKT